MRISYKFESYRTINKEVIQENLIHTYPHDVNRFIYVMGIYTFGHA